MNRNAGIESDSVSENLKARVEMQQSLAQASAAFLGLLKEMDESLRALPENIASTGEFAQLRQAQNIMRDLLDGSAKQFTARAAQYASMGKAPDGSSATYNIPFGNAGALTIE